MPTDAADSLAKALLQLIKKKEMRRKMGTASFTKIKQSFSWQKTMAELESYYKLLIVN